MEVTVAILMPSPFRHRSKAHLDDSDGEDENISRDEQRKEAIEAEVQYALGLTRVPAPSGWRRDCWAGLKPENETKPS